MLAVSSIPNAIRYKRLIDKQYKNLVQQKKYERFKNQLPQDKRDINKITVSELFDLVKNTVEEKMLKQQKEQLEKLCNTTN